MDVEWIKRMLRDTPFHRLYRRTAAWRTATPSPSLEDVNFTYDRQTVEVMHRVLRKDSICVDVGAHTGEILRHLVAIAGAGTHHAFEALPHFAEDLRERFPSVQVHQIAVSDSRGEAEFQHVENDPSYSGLRRRLYDRPDPRIVAIRVPVGTLDEEIPVDQPVAFIKMDIEGGEYHALKGAIKTIQRGQPVIVFEAGSRSTGQYGVTAADLYDLVTSTIGYDVSTMARYLAGEAPMTKQQFLHNWDHGPDFYFIATPAMSRA